MTGHGIQAWRRLGLVFRPDGTIPWMRTHAANPTPLHLGDERYRIYFGSRDDHNRTHICFVEIDIREPARVLRVCDRPALAPGGLGLFDDSGVSMGCLLAWQGRLLLYYLGWNLGVTVPWRNAIGLAMSDDGGETFSRASPAPVLDRNHHDPFSLSYPFVLADGSRLRMWYGSNQGWGAPADSMRHVIKEAASADGRRWETDGHVAVDLLPGEIGISRPWVVRDQNRWRMWFSRRSAVYRLGYAESADGCTWTRRDDLAGLDVAPAGGMDDEAVCYPAVFDHAGRRYMLYNGNGYGRSGLALAVLEG